MAKEQDPSDPKKLKPYNNYLKYSGLAIQLVLVIGLGGWLGYKLDLYFQLKFPAFLLSLGLGAFVGAMIQLYRSLNQP